MLKNVFYCLFWFWHECFFTVHICAKLQKRSPPLYKNSVSISTEEFLPISLEICQKQTNRNIYTTQKSYPLRKKLVEALKNNLWQIANHQSNHLRNMKWVPTYYYILNEWFIFHSNFWPKKIVFLVYVIVHLMKYRVLLLTCKEERKKSQK